MGLAQRAFEEATKYSLERKTMGKPIAMVRVVLCCVVLRCVPLCCAIQFMLADMAIGIESSRLTVLKSAYTIDQVRIVNCLRIYTLFCPSYLRWNVSSLFRA